ncbi:MAG TPA: thioredoxin domain-containing protein [Candidatus Levybacteria bacterium]|nr:thioredoxin domain-containing protein [Candidatus Levybacteria bacterium]
MAKKPTKKELKALQRMEREQQMRSQVNVTPTRGNEDMMKWITFGVVATIIIGLLGFIIYSSQQRKAEQERLANTPVTIADTGWVKGATESAQVTLVEYADFQCPACQANVQLVKQIIEDYPEDVKFVYKHFPLSSIHKNAVAAGVAAEAAGKQEMFWEMHDLLFEKQAEWSVLGASEVQNRFVEYAQSLGLDTDMFRQDLNDKTLAEKVNTQQNEGINLGVMGTPTFFANGKRVQSGSYELLKAAVESELSK